MILKLPLSKCVLLKKNGITLDTILKNNEFKICSGGVDQYVVSENNKLYGVISSLDIEKKRDSIRKADFKVEKLINHNLVMVVMSWFERGEVEAIFSGSPNIKSVPIVDKDRILQYVYIRVNPNLRKFVKDNMWMNDHEVAIRIRQTIEILEKKYREKRIVILTDLIMEDEKVWGGLKESVVTHKDITLLNRDKDIVLLAFTYDFHCQKVVGELIENNIHFLGCNINGKDVILEPAQYYQMDSVANDILIEESYYNGNYFDLNDFQNLFQAIKMTRKLEGIYVEIGVYRGDSARAALSYMQRSKIKRRSFFLDTYEGFEYDDAANSSDCWWTGTHDDTSIDFVDARLQGLSDYQLIKTNIITDKLSDEIQNIVVCNIDVDIYEAVEAALEQVKDRMIRGGIIITEDYGHTPVLIGAQYAINKFMEKNEEYFYGMYLQSGQFLMIKK